MLSLGGFFLALVLGEVILGWDQSQPVGITLQIDIGLHIQRISNIIVKSFCKYQNMVIFFLF